MIFNTITNVTDYWRKRFGRNFVPWSLCIAGLGLMNSTIREHDSLFRLEGVNYPDGPAMSQGTELSSAGTAFMKNHNPI